MVGKGRTFSRTQSGFFSEDLPAALTIFKVLVSLFDRHNPVLQNDDFSQLLVDTVEMQARFKRGLELVGQGIFMFKIWVWTLSSQSAGR